MVAQVPPGVVWTSFAIGRMQMPWVAQSVLLGGHVRVGLEDNLYLGRGNKVTNAELVANAVTIITAMGAEVATAGRGPRDPRAAAQMMTDRVVAPDRVRTVACVGAGVIGGGWVAYFLARGFAVRAWDPAPDAEARLRGLVDAAWPALTELGLAPGASVDNLTVARRPRRRRRRCRRRAGERARAAGPQAEACSPRSTPRRRSTSSSRRPPRASA